MITTLSSYDFTWLSECLGESNVIGDLPEASIAYLSLATNEIYFAPASHAARRIEAYAILNGYSKNKDINK